MSGEHATREAWVPQTRQDRDAILRELHEVLASPHFCNSKRYPALLQFIVENALAGRPELLKERTLGVEVFDRSPTYDTNSDTVVRYTAGEVRKRLMLYYSEHGRSAAVRISLPPGSYVPEFLPGHGAMEAMGESTEPHSTYLSNFPDLPNLSSGHGSPSPFTDLQDPASLTKVSKEAASSPASALVSSPRIAANRKVWLWAAALGVLVLGLAFAFWWKSRDLYPQTAVDEFWAPILRDQHMVVLCTGSVIFKQNNYSGVTTASKNIDYPFVSMQTASAITQISGLLQRSGAATQLTSSASTPLTELREHSVALLGGYNNQWTLRLLDPLRFHFATSGGEMIVDRMQPQVQWERDESLPYASADDYAVLARFRDPMIDGWVVVLAGVGRNGTEAAAQFATIPHYMQLLKDKMGSSFSKRNVEAVLKVNVIDGKTGAPSIAAVHSWD
jgi:hypothetical protein